MALLKGDQDLILDLGNDHEAGIRSCAGTDHACPIGLGLVGHPRKLQLHAPQVPGVVRVGNHGGDHSRILRRHIGAPNSLKQQAGSGALDAEGCLQPLRCVGVAGAGDQIGTAEPLPQALQGDGFARTDIRLAERLALGLDKGPADLVKPRLSEFVRFRLAAHALIDDDPLATAKCACPGGAIPRFLYLRVEGALPGAPDDGTFFVD